MSESELRTEIGELRIKFKEKNNEVVDLKGELKKLKRRIHGATW